MALGILEPADEHVPGTVHVYDEQRRTAELLDRDTTLHRDKTGRIILVPQPNRADANDPLNLPLWQRDLMLAVLCFVSVIATTASPLLAADSATLAIYFKKLFKTAPLWTAWHLFGVGIGAWIFVPIGRIWGKRALFLFGALLMIASSVWGGETHKGRSFRSLLWARIFQGVALAPFESLVNTCVGDLYFVHERGPRMAIVNVALFGGAFLTPVFVGLIAHNPKLGWQWTFYLLAIFMALGFLLLFFFVPETAYRRPLVLETDFFSQKDTQESLGSTTSEGRDSDEKHIHTMTAVEAGTTPRRPYWKRLLPFDGRKTDESFFKLLIRPLPLFFHPAIIWACLMQGVIIGWTVIVAVIISFVFLGPPLFFSELQTGKLYTSAFIGTIVGLVLSAVYTEVVTRFMVRRNGGKYEPEFRLLLIIPTVIFAVPGLYGFGLTAGRVAHFGWIVPDVFLGFVVAATVMGAIGSAQYVLDAHRDISVEAFTCMIIFKNIFSFILAYFAYDWVAGGSRVKPQFIIFGSIEVVICALTIPMYVFGKMNRAFFHRHDILKNLGLR